MPASRLSAGGHGIEIPPAVLALAESTGVVFIMFFFWVWLIGPVGALMAMPITVLIVLVLRHNEPTRWLAALLSDERGSE